MLHVLINVSTFHKKYLEYFLVFGNEKGRIIFKIELKSSSSDRCQEIVVNKIITTESDQDQSIVYEPPGLIYSNHANDSPLVLFEIIYLLPDLYYVRL